MSDVLEKWKDFPKIGLVVEGEKKFYPLSEAIPLWDSGMIRVEDTGELLLENSSTRRMTPEENRAFQRRVDNYSASK